MNSHPTLKEPCRYNLLKRFCLHIFTLFVCMRRNWIAYFVWKVRRWESFHRLIFFASITRSKHFKIAAERRAHKLLIASMRNTPGIPRKWARVVEDYIMWSALVHTGNPYGEISETIVFTHELRKFLFDAIGSFIKGKSFEELEEKSYKVLEQLLLLTYEVRHRKMYCTIVRHAVKLQLHIWLRNNMQGKLRSRAITEDVHERRRIINFCITKAKEHHLRVFLFDFLKEIDHVLVRHVELHTPYQKIEFMKRHSADY